MLKLNRLDGWERLGVTLGVVCALAVAIYAPFDESGTFTKGSNGASPPWYGIALSSRVHAAPAPAPEAAALAPAPEAATPIQDGDKTYIDPFDGKSIAVPAKPKPAKAGNVFDQFDKPSATNRGPWTDDPPAELSDAEVWDPDLYVDYLDVRITVLFMLLAGVLPFAFIYVARWIYAGFKEGRER